MSNRPTLSVCMPNYNEAQFLPESLPGIVEQSFQPTEFLIIDDCSTDNSYEILEQYAQRYPFIRLVRNEQNMGVVYTLNRLLELSTSDYVLFTSANDKNLPGLFEKSMNLLAQYPQAGLCSSLLREIDEAGNDKGLWRPTPIVSNHPTFLTPEKVLQLLEQNTKSWTNGHTSICRRQALIDEGGFIPELGYFTDKFIFTVIALRHGACFVPEPLSCWRRGETGFSANQTKDMEKFRSIFERTSELMRTTYCDLFSEVYVQKWEQRNYFDFCKGNMVHYYRQQEAFLDKNFRLFCLQPTWFDHLFQTFLRMLIKAPRIAIQLYWFARHSAWTTGLRNRYRRSNVAKRHPSSSL